MPTDLAKEAKDYLPPSHFIKFLENHSFERHRPIESSPDFSITYLDLTPIQLNVGLYVPFFVPTGLPVGKVVTADQLDALVEKVRAYGGDNSRYFSVLVIGNHIQYDHRKRRHNIGRHDVVVMDLATIRSAYATQDDEDALRSVISSALLEYLGRDRLSPYQHSTVAIAGRFFGRSDILERVRVNRSSNFVFSGNRRIGKTSLLMEIRRQLLKNTAIAWVYGNTCHTTYDVLNKIIADLRPEVAERSITDKLFLERFPSLVQHIPDQLDRDVAIFIDELDHVLEFDEKQRYDLLERLRGVSLHERCRVFMAGFRQTEDAARRKEHPLYNLGQTKSIVGLSRREIDAMVSKPLSRLNVPFDPNLTVAIENETAGHPELIQVFCDIALKDFETRNKPISPADLLAAVFEDDTFRQKVLGSFLTNFNVIERLACYLLFRKAQRDGCDFDKYEFGLNELEEVLRQDGLMLTERERNVLLNNLQVGGTVLPVRGSMRFRIAVPQLGWYCAMMDLDRSIAATKLEIDISPRYLDSLLTEPRHDSGQEALSNT
jgi:hypothetical protein